MATSKEIDKEHGKGHLAMNTPPIVSQQEWEAARQQLLVKEKALTRSRDALAAERRRMPWLAVEKKYEFDGPKGKVSLLDLFEGRRQLIVYRAFFEPGVFGWPEHACRGCSLGADQVAHLHIPRSGAMSVLPRWVKEYSTAIALDLVTRLVINPVDSRLRRVLVSMRWETLPIWRRNCPCR